MKTRLMIFKMVAVAAIFGWAIQSQAHVGLEGGVAITSSDATGSKSNTNLSFGLFGEYPLGSDSFVFRPELLYTTSGPDYLNVPLMFAYKFDTGSAFKPYIFLGPEVDIRVSSGATVLATSPFKTLDIRATGGVGADYWVTSQLSLGLNWRYSLGLLNQNNTAATAADFKIRAMYILAAVGYKF